MTNNIYTIAICILLIGILSIGVLSMQINSYNGINNVHNCVILKQHCGFDGLETSYYIVKDLNSGIIRTVNVNLNECNIYKENDTISPITTQH